MDQDDKLNLDEFFGFCDELCVGITPEQVQTMSSPAPPTHGSHPSPPLKMCCSTQVQALLEKYDNDESGNIGFAEFSKAMLGR